MIRYLSFACAALLLLSCARNPENGSTSRSARARYFNALVESNYDMIVMDYSQDGSEQLQYTEGDILDLQSRSHALVMAVVSLGEAEINRFYWNVNWDADLNGVPDSASGAPSWLQSGIAPANTRWNVKYWENTWREVLMSPTNSIRSRLLQAGFDGAYLAGLEVWKRFPTIPDAELRMANLVRDFADSMRLSKPSFQIVLHNAGSLLQHQSVLERIQGAARDECFYGYQGHDGWLVPDEIRIANLNELLSIRNAGLVAFAIDYPFYNSPDLAYFDTSTLEVITNGQAAAASVGAKYYPAVRNWNDIVIVPGREPSQNVSTYWQVSLVNEFCIAYRPSGY